MAKAAVKSDDVFQKAGRRSTAQRRLILEVLRQGPGHMDAETLHDRVKARYPRLSLATVYRSLTVLEKMGLVARHSLGEEHSHFEPVVGGSHYHFTCLDCGAVIEFQAPEAMRAAHRLSMVKGITVTDIRLNLSGYCKKCRNRVKKERGRKE
jgi:Fe2+ or Zn2+ uptake regulation protein